MHRDTRDMATSKSVRGAIKHLLKPKTSYSDSRATAGSFPGGVLIRFDVVSTTVPLCRDNKKGTQIRDRCSNIERPVLELGVPSARMLQQIGLTHQKSAAFERVAH